MSETNTPTNKPEPETEKCRKCGSPVKYDQPCPKCGDLPKSWFSEWGGYA